MLARTFLNTEILKLDILKTVISRAQGAADVNVHSGHYSSHDCYRHFCFKFDRVQMIQCFAFFSTYPNISINCIFYCIIVAVPFHRKLR